MVEKHEDYKISENIDNGTLHAGWAQQTLENREFRITLPQSSQSQRTADVTGTLDYQAKTR